MTVEYLITSRSGPSDSWIMIRNATTIVAIKRNGLEGDLVNYSP